jgi:hypothetical protein
MVIPDEEIRVRRCERSGHETSRQAWHTRSLSRGTHSAMVRRARSGHAACIRPLGFAFAPTVAYARLGTKCGGEAPGKYRCAMAGYVRASRECWGSHGDLEGSCFSSLGISLDIVRCEVICRLLIRGSGVRVTQVV